MLFIYYTKLGSLLYVNVLPCVLMLFFKHCDITFLFLTLYRYKLCNFHILKKGK